MAKVRGIARRKLAWRSAEGTIAALILLSALSGHCVVAQGRSVCAQGAAKAGVPLVVYLHGYGGEGADDALGLRALADRFAYAAPDALPDDKGLREWRGADVAFLAELIPRLARAAQAKRVHLVGFSLGGFLALELACTHPELIASAASVSGTRFAPAARCVPGSVSTLHIHGDSDTSVDPNGGIGKRTGQPYLSARAAASLAAAAAGCSALAPSGAPGVERASGCRHRAKVELRMIAGMGHRPASVADDIWRFVTAVH